jgi:hypothetical protein
MYMTKFIAINLNIDKYMCDSTHMSLFPIGCLFHPTNVCEALLTRVNSTNVLDEGFRIGGVGRQMNSKVNSVKQGMY